MDDKNLKPSKKHSRDEADIEVADEEKKVTKALRHDIEIPIAEVDEKLAEKLDNILKISFNSSRPKFLTNKPKQPFKSGTTVSDKDDKLNVIENEGVKTISPSGKVGKLVSRGLTREQIKERVGSKYDYLTQEPKMKVNLVKVLSATESLKLGKEEAKKQIVKELELSSVTKNLQALKEQAYRKYKFTDGYE